MTVQSISKRGSRKWSDERDRLLHWTAQTWLPGPGSDPGLWGQVRGRELVARRSARTLAADLARELDQLHRWVRTWQTVFERKSTRATISALVLNAAPTGWLELRQVRIGRRFYLLRRAEGGKWIVHWTYVRRDLPATLQVGFDAQSGSGDDHADLLARVDYVHYAPTNLPPRLRARVLRGRATMKALRPYLTR